MVRELIWLSLILAVLGGLHGVSILWRRWQYFVRLGGLGRFLAQAVHGLQGQLMYHAGMILPRYWRRRAKRWRRQGRVICEGFELSVFDALLLPILITSTGVAFWWAYLAYTNLFPDPLSASPWWKMAPDPEAAALALNFALYDVYHISVVWIVHIWIGGKLAFGERQGVVDAERFT